MVTSFPEVEAWDGARGVVTFLALCDGKAVACSITRGTMARQFGAEEARAPLECFRKHRGEIEMMATRKLDARQDAGRHLLIDEGVPPGPTPRTPLA